MSCMRLLQANDLNGWGPDRPSTSACHVKCTRASRGKIGRRRCVGDCIVKEGKENVDGNCLELNASVARAPSLSLVATSFSLSFFPVSRHLRYALSFLHLASSSPATGKAKIRAQSSTDAWVLEHALDQRAVKAEAQVVRYTLLPFSSSFITVSDIAKWLWFVCGNNLVGNIEARLRFIPSDIDCRRCIDFLHPIHPLLQLCWLMAVRLVALAASTCVERSSSKITDAAMIASGLEHSLKYQLPVLD